MNAEPTVAPPILNPAPPQRKTLRRLFLTLYLRGRSSRGLRLKSAPKTVGEKLLLVLLIYGLFGLFACSFVRQPVFALSVYLHGITFVFLGMFVSSSAGEILFNKDEAEILQHRPVSTSDLLWTKVRVLIEVSLWLAGSLNLVGLIVGVFCSDGGIRFPLVHVVSTTFEALFCTGFIVLTYQLCLRWFGRERLDALMTMAQVIVAVAAVMAGQIMPRLVLRLTESGWLRFGPNTWWLGFLPPAWFAGMDDALAGGGAVGAWVLAGLGFGVTLLIVWLAFDKLAHDYEAGLQTLGETVSRPRRARSQWRWTETLANIPPLKWFSPVSRAGFILTTAYLLRDRDVKLRVFPGIAPMFIMPFIFLFQDRRMSESFGLAFAGGFLATVPLIAIDLLQYSQQWQASDIFRVAPMAGPGDLCHGARRAVMYLLAIPAFIFVTFVMWLVQHNVSHLLLLLPGAMIIPITALIPAAMNRGTPLSHPNEEAKSAARGLKVMGVMIIAMALSGVSIFASKTGWFHWMLLGELTVALPVYFGLRALVSRLRWQPIE